MSSLLGEPVDVVEAALGESGEPAVAGAVEGAPVVARERSARRRVARIVAELVAELEHARLA